MRLLYAGLESLLKKLDTAGPAIVQEFPIETQMTTTMIYLGPVGDLISVQVKKDKVEKGWMYNTNSIVFFNHKDVMYEVFISDLRDLALDKLKEKRVVKPDAEITAGVMVRFPDGRILGYINTEDLITVSNKMQE